MQVRTNAATGTITTTAHRLQDMIARNVSVMAQLNRGRQGAPVAGNPWAW